MSTLPLTPIRRCALAVVATVPGDGIDDPKPHAAPPLTEDEAIKLKHCILRDVGFNISGLVDAGYADGVGVYTPPRLESVLRELLPKNFKLFRQRGETLGEILSNAVEDLLSRGFPSVCLVNGDCPTLPQSFLRVAVDSLAKPGDHVVLGPVEGGGYSLVGLKEPHPDLFGRVTTSTSNLAAHTSAQAASIGLRVDMMPPWYAIHDERSLDKLVMALMGPERNERAFPAPFTRQFLSTLIEKEGPRRISPSLARARGG
jgi:uncharacterized protein